MAACTWCFACCRTPPEQEKEDEKQKKKKVENMNNALSTPETDAPKQQLLQKKKMEDIIEQQAPAVEIMRTVFQTVRILVVGRSGSGKTTLIRHLVGKDGPKVSVGQQGLAGEQDINVEWFWTVDEGLPLIIHDSNGMDVQGQKNHKIVQKFVKERQKSSDISYQIHLIWYVISAADNRFADDCDLMATVFDANVPILLILTHNDISELVEQNVTEEALRNLLRSLPTDRSDDIRRRMVLIGHRPTRNEIDYNGLQDVSRKSRELLDKQLRYTWIAAQVVDLQAKLSATTALIQEYGKRVLTTDLFLSTATPFYSLLSAFGNMHDHICKIWDVPARLRTALWKTVVMGQLEMAELNAEGTEEQNHSKLRALIRFLGFLVTLGATAATIGLDIAGGLVKVNVQLDYSEKKRKVNCSWHVFTCGIRLLLAVLFVLSRQPGAMTCQNRWNDQQIKDLEYDTLCSKFYNWDLQAEKIKSFLGRTLALDILPKTHPKTSSLQLPELSLDNGLTFLPTTLSYFINDFALDQYDNFFLTRKTSLYSRFSEQDKATSEIGGESTIMEDNDLELDFLDNQCILSNDNNDHVPQSENEVTNNQEDNLQNKTLRLEEYYRDLIKKAYPYCLDFIDMIIT